MASDMLDQTIGPVQFIVIGLDNENLKGQIARELHAASEKGYIRVIDALAIQKRQDGSIVSLGATDLSPDQRMQYGAIVGGLMGFGATGTESGAVAGAELGAASFAERDFGLSDDEIQAVGDDIPTGKTALFVLFEHRWAVRLKEALQKSGGFVIAQGMVSPESLMLLGAGLAAAADAADQYEASQGGPAQ
ncbi:MAG TPA: DUF1269 domain-containing protein [Ktedonobacterales bacterium]|nr:DUF1269 domain-containing protein [Ktedonobacterales bacterium]